MTQRSLIAGVCFIYVLLAVNFSAFAQGTPPDSAWRSALHSWCETAPSDECAQVNGLDPASAGGSLIVADHLVRSLSVPILEAAQHPDLASPLRDLPPLSDRASASTYLSRLLDTFVALLPPRARRETRAWTADLWWEDLARAEQTSVWQRLVRDGDSPAAIARRDLAHMAQVVKNAMADSADASSALDGASEIATQAIAHGVPRWAVIRVFVQMIATMPRRVVAPVADAIPETPSRAQVMAAMEPIRSEIERCVGAQDGLVQVRFAFDHNGHSTDVSVQGTFAGTMVASCARTAALNVSLPPFSRPTFSILFPFAVSGGHPDRAVASREQPVVAPTPVEPTPPVQIESPAAEVAAIALPNDPSPIDVDNAFARVTPTIQRCAASNRGTVALTMVVSGNGEVQSAHAAGRLSSDTLSCIEAAAMDVHFARFAQASVSLMRRVSLAH